MQCIVLTSREAGKHSAYAIPTTLVGNVLHILCSYDVTVGVGGRAPDKNLTGPCFSISPTTLKTPRVLPSTAVRLH